MNSLIISNETKEAIKTYLEKCNKYKNSYFWSNFGNSSQRSYRENQEQFSYSGDSIELEFSISLSRKNCYVTKSVIINGKKTNANALKKYIKEES